jgi:hypothetical protein
MQAALHLSYSIVSWWPRGAAVHYSHTCNPAAPAFHPNIKHPYLQPPGALHCNAVPATWCLQCAWVCALQTLHDSHQTPHLQPMT